MVVVNRRYYRLGSFFLFAIGLLVVGHYVRTPFGHHTLDLRKVREDVVVDVGVVRCVKVFGWESCLYDLQRTGRSDGARRHVIRKDLDGKVGPVRVSRYLYYEHKRQHDVEDGFISGFESNPAHPDEDHGFSHLVDEIYVTKHKQLRLPIRGMDVLFNVGSDERRGWKLQTNLPSFSDKISSHVSIYSPNERTNRVVVPQLAVNGVTKHYKILQLADLHFSVDDGVCRDEFPPTEDCKADSKTIGFVKEVLELENPDLVIFTGDQIMGDRCKLDSTSALMKVVTPIIECKVPWAMVWGNHDDEGSLTRMQLSKLAASLPYSVFKLAPKVDTDDNSFGVGNYIHKVENAKGVPVISLLFMDSHKYSKMGKIHPGYDWIKNHQLQYIRETYGTPTPLNLAFFHIPIPEYLNSKTPAGEPAKIVGNAKEGVTAPNYNSGTLETLKNLNVQVVSVGHDHVNDYCLLEESFGKPAWLCYGGGTGEGGYGGYGGTERRIRVYNIDPETNNIFTWKRLHGFPGEKIDEQLLVQNGIAV